MDGILGVRFNPVHWDWLIWLAMFFAGTAAGAYLVAALLEAFGRGRGSLARTAQVAAFLILLATPLLLTVDLSRPERFWHMVIQSETLRPMLKPWSPMSLGTILLVLFSGLAFLSFLDALIADGRLSLGPWRRGNTIHGTPLGLVLTLLGAVLAVAVGAYSGVLLSVTNIPGWANSVLIGAVYVATSLRTGVAAVLLVQRLRDRVDVDLRALEAMHVWLILFWLVVMAVFLGTLGDASRVFLVGAPLLAMIAAILIGGLLPLGLHYLGHSRGIALASALAILAGGVLVRYAIVMGPQLTGAVASH
jgi:formate-dependent nitrite reductase membrane component NrfD